MNNRLFSKLILTQTYTFDVLYVKIKRYADRIDYGNITNYQNISKDLFYFKNLSNGIHNNTQRPVSLESMSVFCAKSLSFVSIYEHYCNEYCFK